LFADATRIVQRKPADCGRQPPPKRVLLQASSFQTGQYPV